jgi:cell division protein FtsX
MKQVLRFYGKFIITKPLWLILVLAVCSIATAQIVVLSSLSDAMANQNILPESVRTIMVFVKSGTSQEEFQKLKSGLSGINGVQKTVFISRKEGLKKMKEWLGSDSPIASGLEEDILPDAFAVILKDSHLSSMQKIAGDIEKFSGIEKTRYNMELAGRTASLLKGISELSVYVLGLYTLCLGFLIFCSSKIRLTKKNSMLSYRESLLSINLAIILEGVSYVLISAAAGRYLADIAAGQAILIMPEIRNIITIQSLRPVLIGIGFSALFGIAGAVFSLKVRE